jgi:hypothetical protein
MISMNVFATENDMDFRQYSCESSDRFFEFYFDWNEPNLNTIAVAVKVKDKQNITGAKYLVKDANYQRVDNSNGAPCINIISYNAIQTDMTLTINFCDGKHQVVEIFSGVTRTSKLKCMFL